MTKVSTYAGMDVSKGRFDVCVLKPDGSTQSQQFSNNTAGFEALSAWLPRPTHCILEVTGPYYLRLALYLHERGFSLSVVNPLVVKHYAKMKLRRAKTDKADAALLARYALEQQPSLWTPPQSYVINLQQLDSLQAQLMKQRTALSNQLQAYQCSSLLSKEVEELFLNTLSTLQQQIKAVENQQQQLLTTYHGELLKQLTSIPGLGHKTALVLIMISGGFSRFDTYKQLSAYIGLSPRIYDSGTIKGKTPICKMGMSRIRALLYMCAWSAKRSNKACRELYERLIAKGKAKKVALIAVANKLLKQAFAIAKSGIAYSENYQKIICS